MKIKKNSTKKRIYYPTEISTNFENILKEKYKEKELIELKKIYNIPIIQLKKFLNLE